MAGNFPLTAGSMRFNGKTVAFHRPVDARAAGIEVVYQDLALADNLSAAANVFLGRELHRRVGPFRFLDHRRMEQRAAALFGELKSETRPADLVRQMSGGQRQAVAIARTRLAAAQLIIMDEPTAAISVRQIAEVLALILRLKEAGVAVILISHRMPDVFDVCDRVVVMRRGRKVADKPVARLQPARGHRVDHGGRSSMPETLAAELSNVGRAAWHRRGFFASQTAYVTGALLLLAAVLSTLAPVFLSMGNLVNVATNFSYIAIVSLGATLVIITGGIDLSVGSVMALTAILTALLFRWFGATPLAAVPGLVMAASVLGGLGAAGAVGGINGWLIARMELTPFVTTLGMLSVARGLCYAITRGAGVGIDGADADLFSTLTDGTIFGLPMPLLYLLVLVGITAVVLHHTATGRYIFTLGGNERAARLTGVPVTRVKAGVYVASALLAGFAGILMAGWLGSVPANLAQGYELRIIAAAVIGGREPERWDRRPGRRRRRCSLDRGDPQRPRARARGHVLAGHAGRLDHHRRRLRGQAAQPADRPVNRPGRDYA